jgi:diguanylate cyclase (GGDEF)-like protein
MAFDDARAEGERIARLAAHRAGVEVTSAAADLKRTVRLTAAQPGLAGLIAADAGCTLVAPEEGLFPNSQVLFLAVDGHVVCSSTAGVQEDGFAYAGATWLRDAIAQRELVSSESFLDTVTGQPSIAIAAPILDEGEAVGVFANIVATTGVADRLAEAVLTPFEVSVSVLDASSQSIVSTTMVQTRSAARPPPTPSRDAFRWIDGVDRIYASAHVLVLGWRVYLGAARDDVVGPAWTTMRRTAVVALVGLLVALVSTAFVFRRVARPLARLRSAIESAADDPAAGSIEIDGPLEIVDVAARFAALMESRAALEDRLRRAAYLDPLTGIASRALLSDTLDDVLATPGTHPAVILVALDRFDHLRSTFGHGAADALLIEAADRLRALPAEGLVLARQSESVFAILISDVSTTEVLVRTCRIVADALDRSFEVGTGAVELGVRMGISGRRNSRSTGADIVNDALVALTEARRTGETFQFLDTALRKRTDLAARIEQELGRAIGGGELVLHYQPIVDIASRQVIGVEALVRWRHPEHGLLEPKEFLATAERTGQLPRIDRWVIGAAIQQAANWLEAGRRLPISINLSPAGLWERETRIAIEHAIAFCGIPADLVTIELTEGTFIDDSEVVAESLRALKALGVTLAVDDFGTGYSSLAYLRRFPIDVIKIDRSFVIAAETEDGGALVDAIMGIARALRLTVVAEGVETDAQVEVLTRSGCTRAQGYLFGEPMSADDVLRPAARRLRALPGDRAKSA